MYLVDTSVWIGCLNEKENEAVARFVDVLDLGLPFGITGVIYGEVLQGTRTTTDFEKLKEYEHAALLPPAGPYRWLQGSRPSLLLLQAWKGSPYAALSTV